MIAEDSIHKIRDVGESTFQRQNNVMQSVLNILSKIVLLVAVGTSLFALIYSVSKNPQSFLNVANFVKKSDSDTSSKPNFVFMLADDLGWNSIGYENYDLGFATPFLSNLASRGIKLDNYYAQEVCTPSRASLLTGRYPLSIGMQLDEVGPEDGWGLNLTETTLPEVLQSQGYATYMVGKWNLGHFSPRYLPTARGFDYFIGFLTGEAYHWSKRQASDSGFHDLIYSNADCYYPYNGTDLHKYSTFFYRDKAIDIINYHDFSTPLFLYVSFQAVHDPFNDIEYFQTGIPTKYLSSEIYDQIMKYVTGSKRVQYAMSLVLLDEAASNIYSALRDVGQLENTYIIFA
jgi:arylsulfatase B/arylsulfatase I/J